MRRARAGASILAACAAAAAVAARPGDASADGGAALLPLRIGAGISAGRAALEAAVEKGLAAGGWTVPSPAADVARRLADKGVPATCAQGSCLVEAARAAAAGHLVMGEVARADGSFVARLRVVRGTDGDEVGALERRCDAEDCSVAELCRATARELAAEVGARIAAARAAVAGPAGAAAPAPVPAAAVGAGSTVPGAPPRPGWRRYAQAGAIAGGAASVAVGVVMLARGPICVDSSCVRHRVPTPHAWIWIGAGAAVAGAGAVWLGLDRRGDPAPVALGVGPGHVALGGRF